jgi:hypothetical protein
MELARDAVDDTPLLDLMGDALKDIAELNNNPAQEDSPKVIPSLEHHRSI